MKRLNEVHWYEGMFVRPHHLQVAFHDLYGRLYQGIEQVRPWSYGVGRLELNEGLMSQSELEITSCEVLFPDGQWICKPGNAEIDRKSFRRILEERKAKVDVFLAIPRLSERDPNVTDQDAQGVQKGRRYSIREETAYDQNTGTNPQPIQTRRLNAQIFFEGESHVGYDVVRIGRIHPSGAEESLPGLDAEDVPPILSLDGWPPLLHKVDDVSYRIRRAAEELRAQVARREIPMGPEAAGGGENVLKLQTLQRAFCVLQQLVQRPRVHPQVVYVELCRIVGDLSAFNREGGPPQDLPAYEHEDIGGCFSVAIGLITQFLETAAPPLFRRRRFEERGENLECVVDVEWLQPTVRFFLAVKGEFTAEQARKMMDPAVVKIASPTKIVQVVRQRLLGIGIKPVDRLPRGLPDYPDVHYFQLERREQQDEFWDAVGREKVIAMSGAPREQGVEYWLYVLLATAPGRTR